MRQGLANLGSWTSFQVPSLREVLHGRTFRFILLYALGITAALAAGGAIVRGGSTQYVYGALVAAVLIGSVAWTAFERRKLRAYLAIEVPLVLLLLSTLVLRQRDAEALSDNPLDPAGLFRVVCIGGAVLLGVTCFFFPVTLEGEARITTRPFRLYCFYVLVVFVGSVFSVSPSLTLYRGLELATAVIVLAGAYRSAGREALKRLETMLYWWPVFLILTAWVGVFFFPTEGFGRIDSPIPYQLQGIVPAVSSNGLGALGVILAFWSLGILLVPRGEVKVPRRVAQAMTILGFVTLLFAQYRTGYAAAAVALAVLLAVRRRAGAGIFIVLVTVVATLWGPVAVKSSQPILLRGQSVERATEISGRLDWWAAGLEVWERSPVFGGGLLTASRFEVLAPLGHSFTSSIHGTWVEALVGTGLLGTAFLLGAALVVWRRAILVALQPGGRLVPILISAVLAVRSLTGPTFESFGSQTLLFLVLALSFRDTSFVRLTSPESSVPVHPAMPTGESRLDLQGTSDSGGHPRQLV